MNIADHDVDIIAGSVGAEVKNERYMEPVARLPQIESRLR